METGVLLAAAPSSQICSFHFFLLRDAFLCAWSCSVRACVRAKPPNCLFCSRNELLQKYFSLLKFEIHLHEVKVKVQFTLEQDTKVQRGNSGIALLFL